MRVYLYIILIASFTYSCNEKVEFDIEKEREEILKLHNQQRDNHFNKDSIAFANQLSDNFISVNRGKITMPTKEENIKRYNSYFSSVNFVKWDDVSDPIIRFSEDGSLAYTIVNKIVEVTYKDDDGNTSNSATHFAWTAIYKKYNGEWKTDCVTSTQIPSE
ncbi:nuclear transport factor 2 family protein [Winogradskyella vincentii]|uniref:Nuclear transport factor 2 family protein n=1 Tax=Winogradskyella vincentii TaxID=2877122 RepID=A0ABS7XWA8_9FLAO|nr:nuclear transport factor 2 family protein [Winogradskyella vincentii]MCA0151656.1 nuclear transport factor 2 family protein [Winogradskyella vincentii]